MIILSHPTGNFNVRTTARVLHEFNLLEQFHTCLSLPKHNPMINFIGGRLKDEYYRRVFMDVPETIQVSHPYREFLRLASSRIGLFNQPKKDSHPLSVFSVYKSFDKQVAHSLKRNTCARAVYSYEDGAKATFTEAQRQGLKCIYELPIGYWKSARIIFEEESELNPEWSKTLPGLSDSEEKRIRKDEELELADTILVASKFVESTIKNFVNCE